MRYSNKRDTKHGEIVASLEAANFSVADTSRVGGGFPDLCIARNGVSALVEIKTLKYLPKLAKTRVKTALEHRRKAQIAFSDKWRGPIITAYTASEVISDFNMLIKRREAYAI
jgi:hypothetical protein